MAGTLYVVATPIGNLEDITVRALRILREVALIAAEDTRRTAHLLTRYGITTPTTSLHEHNEQRKSSALVARLESGESIALVSDAGTPTVSDPGARFIAETIRSGIRVEAIPGPNAAIAALSVSGLLADGFLFLGFPPARSKDRIRWMKRLSQANGVAIFYEAPHRIIGTLKEIHANLGDLPVLVTRELTKVHEELVRGPISEILSTGLTVKGEFTVVIDVGHMTDFARSPADRSLAVAELAREFGQMTVDKAQTKRQVIAELAKHYGVTTREAYRAIEDAKRSGV
jgi:16S rRNA (cytidine1402-2'-O)-methyltransferase